MSGLAERLSADDITWDLSVDLGPDYRDLDVANVVIIALEDAQSYRLLAQQAIRLIYVLDAQLRQLRFQYCQVRDQLKTDRRTTAAWRRRR
jgi:hypothetical protein